MNYLKQNWAIIVVLVVLGFTLNPYQAFAHRSGCHRWHSCPSDTGSYVCGDLGYTSGCPVYRAPTPKPLPKKSPVVKATLTPKIIAPANAYIYKSAWYCNPGYKKVAKSCVVIK